MRRDLAGAKAEARHYWQVEYPQQLQDLNAAIDLTDAEISAVRRSGASMSCPINLRCTNRCYCRFTECGAASWTRSYDVTGCVSSGTI